MRGLHFATLSSLVSEANIALNTLLQYIPKERTGGYLTITRKESYLLLAVVCIGDCDGGRAERYCHLSQEKAFRLFQHKDHVSSWQSRNESNQKYGGAIKASRYDAILSFSGLPELADEALSLRIAVRVSLLEVDEAEAIAAISNNCFWKNLS